MTDKYKCENCGKVFDEFEMNYREAQKDKKCLCKDCRLEAENKILRKLLWMRHGCPFSALYGDDGEMQCGNCRIDFKNQPAKIIEETFRRMGEEKYMQQIKEAKEKEELLEVMGKPADMQGGRIATEKGKKL